MRKWHTVRLGDVCTIKYGKDHKHLVDGKIPVYGSGGIMRRVDKALYDRKSVLIPRKGSLDNLYFVELPFWTVDTLFYTEINESKVTPEFLYYQLKTFDLAGMNCTPKVRQKKQIKQPRGLVACAQQGASPLALI